eukprot:CAMPEP_0170462280 /NCGR_PEP_ID=MMETSP0123-20130129/7847_1 /TAXON_ID=182087 /ORGANISM="Favella ehrenbergii, Strain Fehren 1" /LENGTH=78 /DNA_ID=CAMNT_0010727465 /DNA_START=1063 /DNA_END=1299 /DNA_ORIENTATION=-
MEDVLAAEHNRGLVSQATDHADTAVVLLAVILVKLEVHLLLVVLFDAVLIEAGEAAALTFETVTLVTATEDFRATAIH